MSIITDEMVQAALLAAHNMRRGWYGLPLLSDSSSLGIHGGLGDMNKAEVMRAALAAVAPMIAEAERERVAAAMESYEVQTKVGAIFRKIHVGPAIAAAIRARSTEEGQ